MYVGLIRGEHMLDSQANWIFLNNEYHVSTETAHLANVSMITLHLLAQRGITTKEEIERFLAPNLSDLHHPKHLFAIEQAAKRIFQAIRRQEKILVYGDYDADGVCATALLLKTLRELGGICEFYIPNRFTEGYGLNESVFQEASQHGYRVIITVDTGIANLHEANVAKELGIDLIVTDHHEPQEEWPNAYAIIHPKCSPNYPFKELAGVGVAFKFAEYLLGYFPEHLLDLVALGTIADLVPLLDENRILAYYGLKALTYTQNKGIKALKRKCQIDGFVTEDDVAFLMAPRINAVGRLQSATLAVELLMAENDDEAENIAQSIHSLNTKRQEIVREIFKEATSMIENEDDQKVIVVAKEGWNEGVLGIVASRLVNHYHKPAIVLTIKRDRNEAKGSARSIPAFNLFENGMKIKELFTNFGGHSQAAGMTLPLENLSMMKHKFNELIHKQLNEEDFKQKVMINQKVNIADLDENLVREIYQLAPFGVGNPKPKFLLEAIPQEIKQIGQTKKHLKLQFQATDQRIEGIGFNMGHLHPFMTPNTSLSIVGPLQMNEWNGFKTVQMVIEDVKIKERQLFDHRGRKNVNISQYMHAYDKHLIVCHEPIDLRLKGLPPVKQIAYNDPIQHLEKVDRLFILDLPQKLEQLEKIVYMTKPMSIHACYSIDQSTYLSAFPTREDFKWLYALIAKYRKINLRKYLTAIQRAKNWSKDTIIFIIKVFVELEFIFKDEEMIYFNSNPIKKDLQDSIVYQHRQQQIEIEKKLYYSNYTQLKNWLINCIGSDTAKEEVSNGF